MLATSFLRTAFEKAVPYPAYLAAAKPHEQANWNTFAQSVTITPAQKALIASFQRRVNVLCISGSWCGDCVQQVPILDKIASCKPSPPTPATPFDAPGIDFRLLERNGHPDVAEALQICGGMRVPVIVFMNEDHEFVALAGDRLLSRYRAIAARHLGAFCPLPGAPLPPDEIAATVQDWVDQFERVALLLRLSPKLRQRHAD